MCFTDKKIFIILHNRFPSEKAASLFAAKTAESFANLGCEVELIAPNRKTINQNPFEYYNIKEDFPVTLIPTIDFLRFPFLKSISFRLSYYLFSKKVCRYLKRKAKSGDIFYTNESLPVLYAPKFMKVLYELHDYPESKFGFYQEVYDKCSHILATNKWKADNLAKDFTGTADKIFIELNAVDEKDFGENIEKHSARQKLNLPSDKKIILYTGHLYGWKGADILARAADLLDSEYVIYFVGGTEEDVAKYKQKYATTKNVNFVGHRPHQEMPIWQAAADVLVIPNTAKERISKYYTSPMKLFEYMMSERPIVASDIPSIHEVAKKTVHYFEPDSSKSLVREIEKVIDSLDTSKVTEAKKLVLDHTWSKRAERILEKII